MKIKVVAILEIVTNLMVVETNLQGQIDEQWRITNFRNS